MITVIKNIEVYSPKYLGVKDVVIVDERIEGIYDNVRIPLDFISINKVNGEGKLLFPGFIDSHVHLIGGGGEGSFITRTRETTFEELIQSGITTVVGCLGTDNVCRDMRSLLAKVNLLKEKGLNAYCYTGSYEIPVKTITNNIKEDIMLIDNIIGIGEIALSDHRSSQPTFEEFIRVVSQARIGGLLSGKSGIVNIHLGEGKKKLNYLFRVKEETEIPLSQLLPTHINRNAELLEDGIKYALIGGYIDFTTSSNIEHLEPGEFFASKALKKALESDVPIEKITFTSDGNGSLPKYDEKGVEVGIGICKVSSLYEEVKKSIIEEKIPIEVAIKVITSNVAKLLKLKDKGEIKEKKSADLVIVDKKTLDIVNVFCKGKSLFNKESKENYKN